MSTGYADAARRLGIALFIIAFIGVMLLPILWVFDGSDSDTDPTRPFDRVCDIHGGVRQVPDTRGPIVVCADGQVMEAK